MRWRALGIAAVALIALALTLRDSGQGASGTSRPRTPAPEARRPSSPPEALRPSWSVPARNPFEYEDAPAAPRAVRPPEAVVPAPAPALPLAAPEIRLTGLLRRGGVLKAALSLSGEPALAEVGEVVFGYRVLAVDEDAGVRLRRPDGTEVTLGAPSP